MAEREQPERHEQEWQKDHVASGNHKHDQSDPEPDC